MNVKEEVAQCRTTASGDGLTAGASGGGGERGGEMSSWSLSTPVHTRAALQGQSAITQRDPPSSLGPRPCYRAAHAPFTLSAPGMSATV